MECSLSSLSDDGGFVKEGEMRMTLFTRDIFMERKKGTQPSIMGELERATITYLRSKITIVILLRGWVR